MTREKIILVGFVFLAVLCLSAYAAEMPQYTRTDYIITGEADYMHVGTGNSDSYPDLIVISPESNINVLPGGPGGVFGTPVVTVTGIPGLKMTVADDFNNDGLTDIILNDTLFIAKGNSDFYDPKSLGIENLQTIASTDINGDGNKDLIAIAIIKTALDMRAAEFRTYFGNGDGTFREPVKTSIIITSDTTNEEIDDWGAYYIYYSGDFTGDGVPDLVVRRRFSVEDGYVLSYNWTYIGNSDGTFQKKSVDKNGNMFTMEVKDVNGDGIKDIIDLGKNTHILAGDNTGFFSIYSSIYFDLYDSNYLCFSVADVNGDGILDYIFARMLSFDGDSSLSTALGTGDGYTGEKYTFQVILPHNRWFMYGLAYETEKPLTYDFNNDGCADYIIPFHATGKIAVILSEKSTGVKEYPHNAPILGQNAPNPFNASTTIPYTICRPGTYELAVYDILGRKIATLFDVFQTSGEHHAIWNGKDEHGANAASGCYFYLLNEKGGKGIIASKRMLLMK